MRLRTFSPVLVLAAVGGVWIWISTSMPNALATPSDPKGRVAAARQKSEDRIQARFEAVGIEYPPHEIFIRAFKKEGELELWARNKREKFKRVHLYEVTGRSGGPGPKRKEGDRQVPEGFYVIERFNPVSKFHLSLGIDYPNAADRVLSDQERPGSEIFIHGSDQTVGCLPLGDGAIEELYLAALDAGNRTRISVHIFPARMAGAEWEAYRAEVMSERPDLGPFWEELRPVFDQFERTKTVPEIAVSTEGRYMLKPKPAQAAR